MLKIRDTCSKCGKKTILKGDIGLRNSKTMDLVVVVRNEHGIEKKCALATQCMWQMRLRRFIC